MTVSFPAWLFEWGGEVFLTTRDPLNKIKKLTLNEIEELRAFDLLGVGANEIHDQLNDYETPPMKGYARRVEVKVTITF